MPNAAEFFIELTDKIVSPEFCREFLLNNIGNPEALKIYNKISATIARRHKAEIVKIEGNVPQDFIDECIKLTNKIFGGDMDALIEMIGDSDLHESIRKEAAFKVRILLNQGVLDESFIKRHRYAHERITFQPEIIYRAVESLIKLLESDNPSIRKWVVVALGTRKDRCVVESLIKMLYDEDPDVRRKAIVNLGMIKNPLAVEPLIGILKNDTEVNRCHVADALGLLADPRAIEPLIELFESNPDFRVKGNALGALNMIGSQRAAEFLIRLFESSEQDTEIKSLVAAPLAQRGNRNAMEFLEKLLYDPDTDVRRYAAYILGGLKNPLIINTMIEFLKSQEPVLEVLEDETEKDPEGWRIEHRVLGELFQIYPDIVKNALLNALKKGEVDEDNAVKVIAWANIRNPEAYFQYLLRTKDKNFSYTSSLFFDDMNKISDCCRANLKIGDEAIAILGEKKEKKSVHTLSCPEVKTVYWG